MTSRDAPPWFKTLQSRFGGMLRTPLARESGTLRAAPASYDSGLVRETSSPGASLSAGERLATYNRQYWFRLFSVLHGAFPLTTRLFGHWTFNAYASRFISARPPRGWDIEAVAVGFDEFLEQELEGPWVTIEPGGSLRESAALLEAARIDAAFYRVFRAPPAATFSPTPKDAERLLTGRLVLTPAAALFSELWPLCELRRELSGMEGEAPVDLPARGSAPQFWLLLRKQLQIGLIPLESGEYQLLTLLTRHPVGDALARLETDWPAADRAALPAEAQRWLARSVELGLWVKLEDQD
ncbi:MAG: putative DNA-binding domain-containing protein [Polyangiaceae bacterium]